MSSQRISGLTSIHDVLARVAALAQPVAPTDMAIAQAYGCVLAADVVAAGARPAVPTALWDGWAVRAEAIADAGPYAPMLLAAAPAWVDAGDAMPVDTDAVLPPDAVIGLEVHASSTAGDGVLAAGAEAAAGQVLRRAGDQLRAADLALLQGAGIAQVSIREPLVRVINMSGDDVANVIGRGVGARGARVMGTRGGLDDAIAADCAAVVVVGGTGAGRRDDSVTRLAAIGQVDIHGFGLSPGDTAALGQANGKPVLLLPARLDAALAGFLVVGDALLRALTGAPISPGMPVTLARKIASTVGLAEVVPVGWGGEGVEPLASGYWPLHVLARAAGWVYVPPESEGFAAGAQLTMRAFP